MALNVEPDFMDGFDAYSTTQGARKWTTFAADSVVTPGRSGISGSQGMKHLNATRAVTSSAACCLQFFRHFSGIGSPLAGFVTVNNSTARGVGVTLNGSGFLQFVNTSTLAIIATATDPAQTIQAGTGYYFEFFALAGLSSTGSAHLFMNGVAVTGLQLTGITTISSGTAAFVEIALTTSGALTQNWYDDVYYRIGPSYTTGGDRLGDLVIETRYPDAASGDAGHNQGTPYGGANAFNGLDEPNTQNDETDGVDLTTIGNKHYSSFGAIVGPPGSTVSAIAGVQVNVAARRVTPGFSNIIQPGIVKAGAYGTDYLGTAQGLSDTFTTVRKAWGTRPDASGAFVPADIATGWEFGSQRNA